jgi:hypothetical protein
MATITPQDLSATGTTLTMAAASGGGDAVSNPLGKACLVVQNGGGG